MTQEESIFKMLEQVLNNQKTLLYASQGPVKPAEMRIAETEALLKQVKA